jgi:hypothetical protein
MVWLILWILPALRTRVQEKMQMAEAQHRTAEEFGASTGWHRQGHQVRCGGDSVLAAIVGLERGGFCIHDH